MLQAQVQLPSDPMILLSYVNTKLRDHYNNLENLCSDMEVSKDEICTKLYAFGYSYDIHLNKFI